MKLKINKKHQESTDDFELEFYRAALSCSRLVKRINLYMKYDTFDEWQTDLGTITYTGFEIYIKINRKALYIDEHGITASYINRLDGDCGFYTSLTKGDMFDRTSRMIVKNFINQNPNFTYIVFRMPQILKTILDGFNSKNS